MGHYSNNPPIWFGLIFLVVGVGVTFGGLFWSKSSFDMWSSGVSASGAVSEIIKSRSDDGYSYKPLIRFYANGKEVEFQGSIGSSSPSYYVGEEVEVLYDERAPEIASINSFFNLWLFPIIISLFGLVFASVGYALTIGMMIGRKNKSKLLKTGKKVYAKIEGIDFLNVDDGTDYWKIKASWHNPRDNKVYIFFSEDFYFNPESYVTSLEIIVVIDPSNPKKYAMDISSIPQAA